MCWVLEGRAEKGEIAAIGRPEKTSVAVVVDGQRRARRLLFCVSIYIAAWVWWWCCAHLVRGGSRGRERELQRGPREIGEKGIVKVGVVVVAAKVKVVGLQ